MTQLTAARETATLARYREVEEAILSGRPRNVIARELAEKWGTKRDRPFRYIAAIQAMWLREGQIDAATRKAEHKQRILRLLDLATQQGWDKNGRPTHDLRAAAQLVDLLAKIDGLYDASGPSGEKVNIEAVHIHMDRYYGISQLVETTGEDVTK